jgi:heme A synthase
MNRPETYRRLALAAAIATYILVGLGAAVRASGAGLGCPDWPLCYGKVMPPMQGATAIEFTHRAVSGIVTVLVVASAYVAWRHYRDQREIALPALVAVPVLFIQIILGGITVLLELPPTVVAVHLGNAMILLALLVVVAVNAYLPERARLQTHRAVLRWSLWSAAGTYLLILSGALVLGTGASWACLDWPLCRDQIVPSGLLPLIHMAHRYIAVAIGVLIAVTLIQAWHSGVPALKRWGVVTAVVFVSQVIVGAANVLLRFPPLLDALHLALAAGVWTGLIVLSAISYRLSVVSPERAARSLRPSETS